jgi:hypothetical protein
LHPQEKRRLVTAHVESGPSVRRLMVSRPRFIGGIATGAAGLMPIIGGTQLHKRLTFKFG